MSKHFFQYWKPKQVDLDFEVDPILRHTSSEQLYRVSKDDYIWIVTVRPKGRLSLVGRMHVGKGTGQEEATKRFGPNVYPATYHAIAKDGMEEPLREIDITDIANRLRFISTSKRDRLTIKDGRVDGKQLQAMRELTTDSVSLLESTWRERKASITEDAESLEQLIKSGAGFGNPETNRKVERAAVSYVVKWYEARGWKVVSVESEKRGYDLICSKGTITEHVEVKGVQGIQPSFIVTTNEVRQAHNNSRFVLCIVTSAISDSPKISRVSGREFISRFVLSPLAYRATPTK